LQIESTALEITEKVGEIIGRALKGGEYIELSSDIGGGKTTLTRSIVRGAGSADHVSSPTFTICKTYKAPKFEIRHFDFYRLDDVSLIKYELQDIIDDPSLVIITEWGGVVEGVMPDRRLSVQIERTSETSRQISLKYPVELKYLVEQVC